MAEKSIEIYLNDHLGGAMLGTNLAKQIRDETDDPRLREVMDGIATDIEEDRDVLVGLMEALDVTRNPVKQVTGFLAEKASRIKFSGLSSGEPDQGLFMALESLRLGVAGKKSLWLSLAEVREQYAPLADLNLDELIQGANSQELALEEERIRAGRHALARPNVPA